MTDTGEEDVLHPEEAHQESIECPVTQGINLMSVGELSSEWMAEQLLLRLDLLNVSHPDLLEHLNHVVSRGQLC